MAEMQLYERRESLVEDKGNGKNRHAVSHGVLQACKTSPIRDRSKVRAGNPGSVLLLMDRTNSY